MDKKQSNITKPLNLTDAFNEGVTATSRLRLCSEELFSAAREVVIEHAGEEYRLRLTRQGKLILTK